MPTFALRHRNTYLRERMDDPDCSLEQLEATYTQFSVVNQLVAAWRSVYSRFLTPELAQRPCTLLDIGCGGADVARRLAYWADRDGYSLAITGIDPDARALAYARSRSLPANVRLCQAHSSDLVTQRRQFDFVISNHVLHHLSETELKTLCADSVKLANHAALHNDIRRNDLAYAGFALTRLFFHKSFITEDGLTSIRRSYTRLELANLAPAGWQVEPLLPYRNLLVYRA